MSWLDHHPSSANKTDVGVGITVIGLTEGVGAGLEGQTGAIYTETAAQRTDSDL